MAELIIMILFGIILYYVNKKDLKERKELGEKHSKAWRDFVISSGGVFDEDGHYLGLETMPDVVEKRRETYSKIKKEKQ